MPARKKGGSGGRRENSGKKTGGPQSKEATTKDFNEYVRQKMANWRGQSKEPQARNPSQESEEIVKSGPGRPQLDPEKGPLVEDRGRLAQYKLKRQQDQRHSLHIKKVRKEAYLARKDRKDGEAEKLLETDDDGMEVSLDETLGDNKEDLEKKAEIKTSF